MSLTAVDLALIGGLTAAILAIFAGILLVWVKKQKTHAEKWIGGAIGRFFQRISNEVTEEGGAAAAQGTGILNLGGFKIDPGLIKLAVEYGPQLLDLAKQFGLIKGGTGGAGGYIRP